jgi:hypothetical protein
MTYMICAYLYIKIYMVLHIFGILHKYIFLNCQKNRTQLGIWTHKKCTQFAHQVERRLVIPIIWIAYLIWNIYIYIHKPYDLLSIDYVIIYFDA